MDRNYFARLTRALSAIPSRRDVLRGLAAAGFGLGVSRVPLDAEAKRKCSKKRKKGCKKPPKPGTPNEFGCLDVGKSCTKAAQCCSGTCVGKPGKRTCRAHNTSTCTAADDSCDGQSVACGTDGFCFRTTGKASFCGRDGECMVCARDAECEPTHGPGAACFVCGECDGASGGTACSEAAA